jgi:pyruvate formate lyase activating enzyme
MLDRDRTQAASLLRAAAIGQEAGLKYVYAGNLPGLVGDLEDTRCHACGSTLIHRRGFLVLRNRMRGESCPDCGVRVPGVWEASPPTRTPGSGFPKPVRLSRN